MNLMDTKTGTLLEDFYPAGWDMEKINKCCSFGPQDVLTRQSFWHPDFNPVPCDTVSDFEVRMGHEIAMEIKRAKDKNRQIAFILPTGPMGMYRWLCYFLEEWDIDCGHVHTFNMDEWSNAQGDVLPADDPGSFQYAMEHALYNPLGKRTIPLSQRNFATKENLPNYAEKIAALKAKGASLILVYGIGRAFHIAFWEPHFAAEFSSKEDWLKETHRVGAKLHPLTVEQNALTSFKSRTTLVPCRANTIGPGLFMQADRAIGGCDGVFGRGMQWQGMSLWVTLRYGPDIWIASSFIPTLPGRLFFVKDLAGPLMPEIN